MPEGKVPMFPGSCPDRFKELEAYTDTGDATDEFLIHLDRCPGCAAAVDAVLKQEGEALQQLGEELRKDDDRRRQEKELTAKRFLRWLRRR